MMMSLLLLLLVVPLCLPLITAQPRSFFAGYDSDGSLTITSADSDAPFQWLPNSAAWAQYTDYNHTTDGWSYLNVKTSGNFTADQQSYAAGFLEGSLSALQIWQYVYNQELSKKVDSKVQSFLDENAAYMRSQIQAHSLNDSYWAQVALVYRQLDGVVDGYNSVNDELGLPSLVEQDIFLLNIQDELDDIWPAVHGQEPQHILRDGRGKCSAIVRILPDLSELFVAHTTWSDFPGMLRIYKNYEMNVMTITNGTNIIPGHRSSFPSYPGMLFSGDDFYLLSSGLVVQETTIGNTNASRSIYIQPRTVLEWMRNIVANRLAIDGSTWTDIFGRENSGTYDNQFMVVNYNLFHPGKPLVPNTLWIIEQIPGMIKSADVTNILIHQGYWSSYNIAYFPEIFNASGGWEEVTKAGINGDFFRYDKAPRAQIFKRDAPNIQTLHDLETFMRYNKFKTDPLARCNCTPPFSGENAIAARCDLNPIDGSYPISSLGHRPHGATDAKIATYELFQSFANKAVNGPTHDDQPVFSWSTSDYKTLRHVGLPDSFDFDWTTIDWSKH